jgi:putative SOS response-associated peptidase YedK
MRNKSTFSKHLETGRCVVPAGEFFEWENARKEPQTVLKKRKH